MKFSIQSMRLYASRIKSKISHFSRRKIIKTVYFWLKRKLHKKIHLLFICHRPAVWGSLKTVFEAAIRDERFDVTILAIPNKKQLPKLDLNHEIYESEGAESFFENYPCQVINGFDKIRGKWVDPKALKPDYVFFQQPYNICRPRLYHSSRIADYAHIAYIHYAANFIADGIFEESHPRDFMKDISLLFPTSRYDEKIIKPYLRQIGSKAKLYYCGFPRYDEVQKYRGKESEIWSFPRSTMRKRIIWTPRWNTREGNCSFFDYKDFLIQYCELNSDVDLVFRPHPQAFLEWNATNELPEDEAEKYKKRFADCPNANIDMTGEYLSTFYSADIMITDISSIVAEFFLTGSPIIYCHKKDCFNDFSRVLSKGFYWVHNWNEMTRTLDFLKQGIDPLKETRQKIIQSEFSVGENAGIKIKNIIKQHFEGLRS